MAKEMLINASEGEECRIAVVDDGRLQELYMERTSATSHVGNIYKGKVTNVEASIQAAFIDFGLGRNGFLHISDLMPSYFGKKHEDVTEAVGRKLARRDRPPIQRCLKRGDEIIVQIIKEGIGTKGPTLSTYVSIPGRILVMMPGMSKFGISRKIEDEDERRRLRGILDGLKCPDDVGFIVRTAGVGKNKAEISRDLLYLTRLWKNINDKLKLPAPQELYTEGDLVTRTVRDVFSSDIDQIVVDSKDVAKKIKEFFKIAMPRTKNRVELYDEPMPLFHKYQIEHEIEQIYSRHVPLPSGGSLVIDSTEAVVAIDVNSGKFRDHSDAETTAFKTDMEAADEIPRQLKLRDLGGVIICDFIDLRFERHRRELERRLHDNLKNDRAKSKVLRMSQFGIVEMTRQRMRPSLKKSIYCDCPHCKGSGLVKTAESMSLDMMRRLVIATTNEKVVRVELAVHPEVAFYLLNRKRQQLSEMEAERDKRLMIRHDSSLALDEFRLTLYDSRDGLVFLSELGIAPPGVQKGRPQHGGTRPPRPQRGGRRGAQQPAPRGDQRDDDDDRFDIDDDDAHTGRRTIEREPDAHDDADEVVEIGGDAPEAVDDEGAPPAKQGRGRGRGRGRNRPSPPANGRAANDDFGAEEDDESQEAESQVVDVEDGAEPLGDAPRGYDERGDHRGHRDNRANRDHRHNNDRDSSDRNNGDREHNDRGDGRNGKRRRRRRGGRGRNGDRANADLGGDRGGDRDGPRPNESQAAQPDGSGRASAGHHDPRRGKPHQNAPRPSQQGPQMGNHGDDEEMARPMPGNSAAGGGQGGHYRDDTDGDGQKRRRRRGGRRHRERCERAGGSGGGGGGGGRNKGGKPQQRRPEGLPNDDELDAEAAALEAAERRAAAERTARQQSPPPQVNVVKTGSADKHLADDEPVVREPASRPRTYRDLDALPEYDDD